MESRDDVPTHLEPVHIELWCPNGPELPWRVTTLRGEEQLGQPFEFELQLRCEDANADIEAALGADVELLIERSGLTRIVYGVITEVEVEIPVLGTPDHEGVAVRLVVAPAFALLAQEHDTRIHTGQTVLEILVERLGESLGRYGRKLDVESRIAGSYAQRDYCVQFRESTFDFCSRLMEEEGIAYVFVPDADSQREVMVLVDNNEAYAAVELLATEPLAVVSHAPEQLEHESLQRLDWRSRRTSNRVRSRGYNYKQPKRIDEGEAEVPDRHNPAIRELALEGERRQIIDDPVNDPEATHFTGAELDQRGRAAQLLLQRHQLDASVGHGRSNASTFAAGGVFELAEAIRGVQGSELLLTKVVHEAHCDDPGDRYDYANRFECVPRSLPFRPAHVTFKPRVVGVLTGVVLGRGSDEVHTDALGRVRLRLHADRHADSDEPRACWIRVAQMWAGPGYGAMVLPRAGMEVVISFVDGNPDCPLITGCVYNGENPPPRPLPAELSRSTFKSSSTPGGEGFNELMIEDAKGREQIFVHAQKRMDVRVRQGAYETVVGHKEVHIGPAGDGRADQGDYNATVRRDLNQRIEGDSYEFVGGIKHDVADELYEWFRIHKFVAEDTTTNVKNQAVAVSEHSSHAAKQLVLSGSELLSMIGGDQLLLESNNDISLKVGTSFITVGQSGVDISGPMVRINSGGAGLDAEPARTVEPYDALFPLVAHTADDGRPGGGGGRGGGRRRERESATVPHYQVPELTPARKPLPRPEERSGPLPNGNPPTDRNLIGIAWSQSSVWCSESVNVVGGFDNTGDPYHGELAFLDGDSGTELSASEAQLGSGMTFSTPTEIKGVFPRLVGKQIERERRIAARLAGQHTSEPIRLKFLTELPEYEYRTRYGKVVVWMNRGAAHFSSTIDFMRGWMYYCIDLTECVPDDADGRIGYKSHGHENWWYAKKRRGEAPLPGPPGSRDLLYWNGQAWIPVPESWGDGSGTRRFGMAVWLDRGVVKTQCGTRPWPDPVPTQWPDANNEQLPAKLRGWGEYVNGIWSQQFVFRRVTCHADDLSCCTHMMFCQIKFREVHEYTSDVVIIAANSARANAGAWRWDSDGETVAHEYGHHLGNPDEYPGAATVNPRVNGDGATAGIDEEGLMGRGSTIRQRYYNELALAFGLAAREVFGVPMGFKVQ